MKPRSLIHAGILFCGILAGRALAQAPPNDNFADAIIWSTTSGTFGGTNTLATEEADEPGWWLSNPSGSLWWRWTAPSNGDFAFNTAGSSGLKLLTAVFSGNGPFSNLTGVVGFQVVGSASQNITFFARQGRTYHFRFSGFDDKPYGIIAGSYFFTPFVIPTNGPINDYFERRLPLTGLTNIVDDDNSTATLEPGEPAPQNCAPAAGSMWWSYTAPTNGVLRVEAGGYSNRVVWTVYRGEEVDQLERVASSCELPLNFGVNAGETFQVSLSSLFGKSGGFVLHLFLFPPPPHDAFAESAHFEGTNLVYTGSIVGASREPDEPESGPTNTVWASWAAPFNGRARYWMDNAHQFQNLNVLTGPELGHLQPVPLFYEDNGVRDFFTSEGTVYHFQFSGGADKFSLNFTAAPFEAVDNDNLATARVAGPGDVVRFTSASMVGASMEVGEPLHLGSVPQKSLWWRWQAPRHGVLNLSAYSLFIPHVTLAVYRGPSVDALGVVVKGTNQIRFIAIAGETYQIAAAVPENSVGDVTLFAQQSGMSLTDLLLPGNLLKEPSFEGTALDFQYWNAGGSVGGYVNARGGAHGTTWPVLSTGTKLWQDIPTIPGRNYAIQFAFRFGGDLSACCGEAGYRVRWDSNDVETVILPDTEGYWRWDVLTVKASNTVSRLTIENIRRNLEVDAFSVVDLSSPPSIVTQPSSVSTVAGGAAAFILGANGSAPLDYQWFHNGQPIAGQRTATLVIDPATAEDTGPYYVVVSNSLGVATSSTASLLVDAPTNVTILLQPYGAVIPAGSYFGFSMIAAGTPPLTYQWYVNGEALPNATNRNLTFESVQSSNAGVYEVRVQNYAGSVYSLPATIVVTNATQGGGMIDFRNQELALPGGTNDAPVFDVDGITRLNGSNYVAQLYAGPTLETMRPAASPSPFRTGFRAGFFISKIVTLANIASGATVFAQVRVWEIGRGNSYEEARALGGKFGRSGIMQVTVGGDATLPQRLPGLTSFSLQAGLPGFTVGQIEFLDRNSDGSLLLQVRGEPGFRYVVEKSSASSGIEWRPFAVLTNATGTMTFSDQIASGEGIGLYRARILD